MYLYMCKFACSRAWMLTCTCKFFFTYIRTFLLTHSLPYILHFFIFLLSFFLSYFLTFLFYSLSFLFSSFFLFSFVPFFLPSYLLISFFWIFQPVVWGPNLIGVVLSVIQLTISVTFHPTPIYTRISNACGGKNAKHPDSIANIGWYISVIFILFFIRWPVTLFLLMLCCK